MQPPSSTKIFFTRRAKRGFTLVEMAVVIMIVAMVAGGILLGQDLIRSSKMQSALQEYDAYVKAATEFQDKYMALPGDFTGATALWGTGTCTTSTSMVDGAATCNGNGNGKIAQYYVYDVGASTSEQHERWYAWRHLSNAGLINGKYNGLTDTTSSFVINEFNAPRSAIDGGRWILAYFQRSVGNSIYLWDGTYNHVLMLGATAKPSPPLFPFAPLLTPAEAMGIDTKSDDGFAYSGNIRSWVAVPNSNCTNNATSATTNNYNTANSSIVCSLIFITGF